MPPFGRCPDCCCYYHYYYLYHFYNIYVSTIQVLVKTNCSFVLYSPGTGPINILQCKFYATLIFKQSDWLLKFVNQSGCLKISVA